MARATLERRRIFTADGNRERDPADFTLEGSTDATTWHSIARGSLDLPQARNANTIDTGLDPLTSAFQEVLFNNSQTFTSYRVTFNHTRNDNTANSLQIAELELLGSTSSGSSPELSISRSANGDLVITASTPGTLQSTTALSAGSTTWQNVGPISGSMTIPAAQVTGNKFYRLSVP